MLSTRGAPATVTSDIGSPCITPTIASMPDATLVIATADAIVSASSSSSLEDKEEEQALEEEQAVRTAAAARAASSCAFAAFCAARSSAVERCPRLGDDGGENVGEGEDGVGGRNVSSQERVASQMPSAAARLSRSSSAATAAAASAGESSTFCRFGDDGGEHVGEGERGVGGSERSSPICIVFMCSTGSIIPESLGLCIHCCCDLPGSQRSDKSRMHSSSGSLAWPLLLIRSPRACFCTRSPLTAEKSPKYCSRLELCGVRSNTTGGFTLKARALDEQRPNLALAPRTRAAP
mmetsp:Transcript_48096/g.111402  ORF Transcript_48096/g.111402 Transcript_48096/m.111402 type:complete len:293 (-) Transcript_48096:112-990(-)